MRAARTLWLRVSRDWARWAQVGGACLGLWQIAEWKIAGTEPNVGVMGFAGSLLLFQRAVSARRANSDEDE